MMFDASQGIYKLSFSYFFEQTYIYVFYVQT